nr:signal peptidase I [Clostridia bacterium]
MDNTKENNKLKNTQDENGQNKNMQVESIQDDNMKNENTQDENMIVEGMQDTNVQDKNTQNKNIQNAQHEENKTKKVINIIFKILGITIIVVAITILIRVLVFKKYDILGYRMYLIMSGSMEPTIQVGDAVITRDISNPQIGDVIAFQPNNTNDTTVHRIIKTYTDEEKTVYQTKGDNNNTEDKGLLKIEQIRGKVMFKLPKFGNAILFIKKNIIIIAILLIGIIIVISLIRRLM